MTLLGGASTTRNLQLRFAAIAFTILVKDISPVALAQCIAAYDAMGKTLALPVHDLIGGKSMDVIPCYATTGYVTKGGIASLEEQLAKVERLASSASR